MRLCARALPAVRRFWFEVLAGKGKLKLRPRTGFCGLQVQVQVQEQAQAQVQDRCYLPMALRCRARPNRGLPAVCPSAKTLCTLASRG